MRKRQISWKVSGSDLALKTVFGKHLVADIDAPKNHAKPDVLRQPQSDKYSKGEQGTARGIWEAQQAIHSRKLPIGRFQSCASLYWFAQSPFNITSIFFTSWRVL